MDTFRFSNEQLYLQNIQVSKSVLLMHIVLHNADFSQKELKFFSQLEELGQMVAAVQK